MKNVSSLVTVYGLRFTVYTLCLKLHLSPLYHRLAVERDVRAGEAYEVAVGALVVAAGPDVVADADGDRARRNPRRDGAVRGQLDVRVDAEVDDREEVFAIARRVVCGLQQIEARP